MERLRTQLRLLYARPTVEQSSRQDFWHQLVARKLMESTDGRFTSPKKNGGYYFSIDKRTDPAIIVNAYSSFDGRPGVHNAIVVRPGETAKLLLSSEKTGNKWVLVPDSQEAKEQLHGHYGVIKNAGVHNPSRPWKGGYPDLDEILAVAYPNK